MDEAYVDYVTGNADAGIVNDPAKYPTITEDVIVDRNEKGGEKNISSGWHTIEFLLWGQDTVRPGRVSARRATTPRPRMPAVGPTTYDCRPTSSLTIYRREGGLGAEQRLPGEVRVQPKKP